jgi:hypothetical protein
MMISALRRSLLLALLAFVAANAFTPPCVKQTPAISKRSLVVANSEKKKKKGGFDETLRNKLLTESIAPWRTLRLFLYGSLGSGAFVGGLINTSGAIAGSNSPDFNLNTEVGPSPILNFRFHSTILKMSSL